MRQYHVKLHFHKQKGNYFAYDMWQWQDQVEGKSVSFSKLDYFGVEGNLVYESEGALNRGHVLVKEVDGLAAQFRQCLGEIEGQLAFAAARLAQENNIAAGSHIQ